jgi:hypothetical protein
MAATDNSYVMVNDGTGSKVSFVQRSKSSNTVNETEVSLSLPYIPGYRLTTPSPVSLATASSHLMQFLGSAINRDLLRFIEVTQVGNAAASKQVEFELLRLTTAGTGGTSITPNPSDLVDPATSARGMTLPSAKGTESSLMGKKAGPILTTAATAGHERVVRFTFPETGDNSTKPVTTASGATTGWVLKNVQSDATCTVLISAEFQEVFWQ